MRHHNITSDEYDRRTLEGDESIYLTQPNRKFAPTYWIQRAANVLELDYQGMMDKIARGDFTLPFPHTCKVD